MSRPTLGAKVPALYVACNGVLHESIKGDSLMVITGWVCLIKLNVTNQKIILKCICGSFI